MVNAPIKVNPVFPTYSTETECFEALCKQLPITTSNELKTVLFTYKNSVFNSLKERGLINDQESNQTAQ